MGSMMANMSSSHPNPAGQILVTVSPHLHPGARLKPEPAAPIPRASRSPRDHRSSAVRARAGSGGSSGEQNGRPQIFGAERVLSSLCAGQLEGSKQSKLTEALAGRSRPGRWNAHWTKTQRKVSAQRPPGRPPRPGARPPTAPRAPARFWGFTTPGGLSGDSTPCCCPLPHARTSRAPQGQLRQARPHAPPDTADLTSNGPQGPTPPPALPPPARMHAPSAR